MPDSTAVYVRRLIDMLLERGYLIADPDRMNVLVLTRTGNALMRGRGEFRVKLPKEKRRQQPNSMRLLRKMWTKSCSMRSVMYEPALQHAQACRRTLSFPTQRSLIWLQNSRQASSICCPSAA